jgi:nicotinamidase-related amidase
MSLTLGALNMIALDPKSTALVLIDLQQGILGYELVPNTGTQLLTGGQKLAERFRAAGATVVLVNVDFAQDGADMLRQAVDEPSGIPKGGFPAGWSDFPPGLREPGDVLITKRQWGAFHGTELDLQLRRRGIRSVVLGGVATHIGVESTARQAYEHGYELLIVSDATSSNVAEAHAMSMKHVFPRLARVVASDAITFASR